MPIPNLGHLLPTAFSQTPEPTIPGSFKFRQNRKSAVEIAQRLEENPPPDKLKDIAGQAKELASHLQKMQGAELGQDDMIFGNLCLIQNGIDKLRQAVDDISHSPNAQPRSSVNAHRIIEATATCSRDIGAAQEALDHIIAKYAGALAGDALKKLMKGLYPDPDRLIAQAERILPLHQQRELVDHSKRIQRHTGIVRGLDIDHLVGLAKKELRGEPGKAKSLSWAATRTTDEDRQKLGIGKLARAYDYLHENGKADETFSALESLVSRFDNLQNSKLRRQAVEVFYTNAAKISPLNRGALLIPLFSRLRYLPASIRVDLKRFINQHLGEVVNALPSANKHPDLQQLVVDRVCQELLDRPNEDLAQRLGEVCGSLEKPELRARIGISLMVAAREEQALGAPLREKLHPTVREVLPDMVAYLPRLRFQPAVEQMVTDLSLKRLGSKDLAQADRRKLLQSMALAFPKLGRQKQTQATLLDAFRPYAADMTAALPALKADIALQKGVLKMLDEIYGQHHKGQAELPLAERGEITLALASTFAAHLELDQDFANMCARYADGDVRQAGNKNLSPPVPYSLEKNVLDLTPFAPRDDDDGPLLQSQTRKAQELELDGVPNRAKEIAYGPRHANSEDVATTLLGAAGVRTPKTSSGRYDEKPQVIVSQRIPGFKDLGAFLLDEDEVKPLVEQEWGKGKLAMLDEELTKADDATRKLDALNRQQPTDTDRGDPVTIEKQNKIKDRLIARNAIYQLMPDEIHQKINYQQFVTQLIGDDDFVNYEWYNAGVGDVLDEGNAMLSGLRGAQRGPDNLRDANDAARATDPFIPTPILEEDHVFDGNPGPSRTNVGRIPRSVPVARVVARQIRAETRLAEGAGTHEQMTRVPAHEMSAFTGELEGAYQLSFLPDDATRRIFIEKWPEPDNKDVPYRDKDKVRPTAKEMADTVIARREALVKKFTDEERARWAVQNPAKARAAYNRVLAGTLHYTGIYLPARKPEGRGLENELRTLARRPPF